MSTTTVFTAPDLSEPGSLARAFQMHREALNDGNKMLHMANQMRREAEQAMEDRARMKEEYRARQGVTHMPGSAAEMVSDIRVGGFKIMDDAKADASWFLKRATAYSGEAAAHFAKASAISSYIAAQTLLNQTSRY